MSARRHYRLLYRLDGSYGWLLWFSNDVDGLYVENDRFPSFDSAESLTAYATARGIGVETEEPTLHDLDAVSQWLLRPSAITIDSANLLVAWNLAQDAAVSLGLSLANRDGVADAAYEKLFRRGGPQWTDHPESPDLTADWTPEEIQRLAEVLGRGLDILRSRIASDG
jgi:hypothetical protein